jgi:hypothetical protein
MEKFRNTIKRRITLFSAMLLGEVILGAYCFWALDHSVKSGSSDGFVANFQNGIIFGIGILTLSQIIKLRMVVKDDNKLKMLYNQQHDERLKTIRGKAGMPMLMITSIIMLIAAIIAGYFNVVVFITLIIAATVQLSIGAIVKMYYLKTM